MRRLSQQRAVNLTAGLLVLGLSLHTLRDALFPHGGPGWQVLFWINVILIALTLASFSLWHGRSD